MSAWIPALRKPMAVDNPPMPPPTINALCDLVMTFPLIRQSIKTDRPALKCVTNILRLSLIDVEFSFDPCVPKRPQQEASNGHVEASAVVDLSATLPLPEARVALCIACETVCWNGPGIFRLRRVDSRSTQGNLMTRSGRQD
jgi:hypothetical protein